MTTAVEDDTVTGTVIVPSPRSEFVELSRSAQGRLFRKQILPFGKFVHPAMPDKKINVTKEFAEKLAENFRAGHCDIVQVPIVNASNQHVEDPLRNLGEVVDVEVTKNGVYAVIDARKKTHADELGKTLIGASAMMSLDYTDTKSGKKVGPTLLHVAVTNRPYITNLDGFAEIVQMSADTTDGEPVFLTTTDADSLEENKMDKAELLALLKDEHGIDVEALELSAAKTNEPAPDKTEEIVAALSSVLREAGVVGLSAKADDDDDEEMTVADVAAAVIELSQEKVNLAEAVATLREESDALKLSAAEAEIKSLVKAGRILPTQEEAMLELRLSNVEMFNKIVPDAPLVEMSARGVETHDEPASTKFDEEIARLSELANTSRSGRK